MFSSVFVSVNGFYIPLIVDYVVIAVARHRWACEITSRTPTRYITSARPADQVLANIVTRYIIPRIGAYLLLTIRGTLGGDIVVQALPTRRGRERSKDEPSQYVPATAHPTLGQV